MKRNWKQKILLIVLARRTLCFSSYKNRKLEATLWWVGARKRKKRAFFVPFIVSEGNFFNTCILSQRRVFCLHFQNTNTFTYQKTSLHTLFCLFLKSSKAFSVTLRTFNITEQIKDLVVSIVVSLPIISFVLK